MDLSSPLPPGSAPVVFVGVATFDAIAVVPRIPGPDERMVATDLVLAGGGPAATAAVTAARLGVPAAFVGAVGDDEEGDRILAGLRQEGVDVQGVQRLPGRRSGASVVVVDARRGSRAICTRPVPPLVLDRSGPASDLVRSAAWVHVDHLGWGPVRALLGGPGTEDGAGPQLSVDAGNPIPGFDPRGVALHVPTLEALRGVHGDRSVDGLLDAALAAGARTVVATRGSAGSVAATAGGERFEVPATAVDVVSTLGAGDVFHGALLSAVVRAAPLEEAMRFAGVVAALSCRGVDGRSAIPDTRRALDHVPDPAR